MLAMQFSHKDFHAKQTEYLEKKKQYQTSGNALNNYNQMVELQTKPSINPKSQQMKRNVNDLIKWKQEKDSRQTQKR